MNDNNDKNVDEFSGVETTGHEWDGIKELNNPAPRWWLWVFYICIIWSVGYWIAYPAWPTPGGNSEGLIQWSSYKQLQEDQAQIALRQSQYLSRFSKASFQEIMQDPELYEFAMSGGKAVFKDNCATCHGSGGAGSKGYPNLNDDDWLWGGSLDEIHYTILNGIRSTGEDTRVSQMPAFGKDELLKPDEINAVVDYVRTLSGSDKNSTYDVGARIFKENCAACHGAEGKGGRDVGAPNLTDKIWLYGGDRAAIYDTVFLARKGVMPTWKGRLDENTMRLLTVYLHELGGGEPDKLPAEPIAGPPAPKR